MKVGIVTSFPLDSYTIQAFQHAALKVDPTASVMHIDDMMLAQHPEGDHIIHKGDELPKLDVILALVHVHCPPFHAILDALHHYAEIVINDGQVQRSTMDELALYGQLQKVGVKFPTTVSVFKPEHADQVARSFEALKGSAFPVLVRLLMNKHRNGLIKVDSPGALRTVIEAFCEEEIPFVVQEHSYHRGSFTAYVFGGTVLGATVSEVGEADDEFRTGLDGSVATAAKLDDMDESTMARVSNAVGQALIEVCFIKGPDGRPHVFEVKPYVRFDTLNHSTGQPLAEEIASKVFLTAEALLPHEEAPEEPLPMPEPDDPLPEPPPAQVEVTIHPLNDDRPMAARVVHHNDSDKAWSTIWVSNLKCSDSWISFKFQGFTYKIPRPSNATEVSSDDFASCGPVSFNCKVEDRAGSHDFIIKSDLKDAEHSGVELIPSVAYAPPTPETETADAAPSPEADPTP